MCGLCFNVTISGYQISEGLFPLFREEVGAMKSSNNERILSKLVERNIREWSNREEISRRLLVERERIYMPLIAMSREKGSGGTHIAHLVADRLGFECFDRRIVDFIAKRADMRKEVVTLVDEKTQRGILQQLVDLFQPLGLSEDQYFHHLMQVISNLRIGWKR